MSEQLAIQSNMLTTMMSIDDAVKLYEKFVEAKQKLLKPSDFRKYRVRNRDTGVSEDKDFVIKSGWNKLAFCFNISTDVVFTKTERLPDGVIVCEVHSKALHVPTMRFVTSTSKASSKEKEFEDKITHHIKIMNEARLEHDVLTLAETRSKNRAISNILGSGEVSGEELMEDDEEEASESIPEFCSCSSGPKTALDGKCKECRKYSENWWKQSHVSK